ncbi:MAG: glycerol-3-phosphate acyltransferase, partial [Cyanobacteria bacterium WB6_1B_304]|nr:glycerol-3-phosphate acyltransferase [Cyanobacteria bacterium WB6_1B_304]
MSSVIGLLCILILCPILGGLPLIEWLFQAVQRRSLQQVGTGNISVSAAFYHGGVLLGCGAVGLEALKGLTAVWVTRFFFPNDP